MLTIDYFVLPERNEQFMLTFIWKYVIWRLSSDAVLCLKYWFTPRFSCRLTLNVLLCHLLFMLCSALGIKHCSKKKGSRINDQDWETSLYRNCSYRIGIYFRICFTPCYACYSCLFFYIQSWNSDNIALLSILSYNLNNKVFTIGMASLFWSDI